MAGLLAWTGASSFAELGSTIPLNGSSQAYLNHIFGPLPSFLFSWTAVAILKPGSLAIVSIIFGDYIAKCFTPSSPISTSEESASFLGSIVYKIIAVLGLFFVTAINIYSTRLGAKTGNFFFILKLFLLLALIILGIVGYFVVAHKVKKDDTIAPAALATTGKHWFRGSSTDLGDYAIALYASVWAYDGWDNVNYVSAEMKSPAKDVPRVIHTALPVVIVSYLLANLSYYAVLSKLELDASNTVTLTMANKVIEIPLGSVIFALLIALSCLGTMNVSTFTYARLIYTSAKDGFFPSYFARTNVSRGTPVNSLLLTFFLSLLFIIAGDFESLLTFCGFANYFFYFITVLGVIVLRVKQPDLNRPYKTFIATPIVFCCVALFLVSRTVFEKPWQSLYAVVFILLGVPVYWWRFESFDLKAFKELKIIKAIKQKFSR